MDKKDNVCVCNKVSLGKLDSFIQRENPTVASQLSQCLDAGTSCGWCIPFLEKIHKQHLEGKPIQLGVDAEKYLARRKVYVKKK
jgi:NAD(P)H-nitrite reductase large subunit